MLEQIALGITVGFALVLAFVLHHKTRKLELAVAPLPEKALTPLPAKEVLHV